MRESRSIAGGRSAVEEMEAGHRGFHAAFVASTKPGTPMGDDIARGNGVV